LRTPDGSNRRIALKNSGRRSLILFCWVQEIRPMMGERRVMQEALFYGFSLEACRSGQTYGRDAIELPLHQEDHHLRHGDRRRLIVTKPLML
jgi:hypothetical protein